MKLCAFILAVFKNESDCIIIETPLKEISPQIVGIFGFVKEESSFAPRVTSTNPNKKPLIVSDETFGKILAKMEDMKIKIFSSSKTSEIR